MWSIPDYTRCALDAGHGNATGFPESFVLSGVGLIVQESGRQQAAGGAASPWQGSISCCVHFLSTRTYMHERSSEFTVSRVYWFMLRLVYGGTISTVHHMLVGQSRARVVLSVARAN